MVYSTARLLFLSVLTFTCQSLTSSFSHGKYSNTLTRLSAPSRRHHCTSVSLSRNRLLPLEITQTLTSARRKNNIESSTSLSAVPSWISYPIYHVIGGAAGTPIVAKAIKSWYRRISLPSWTPPDKVFAPTWTTLYASMGVAASRVVARLGSGAWSTPVMKLWLVHLALNLSWAPVFFGWKMLRLGFAINLALIGTLAVILRMYHTIDPASSFLLLPYMGWLIYATKLNQEICRLNPLVGGTNEAMVQANLCAAGEGYNDAMLQHDIKKLQMAAAKFVNL